MVAQPKPAQSAEILAHLTASGSRFLSELLSLAASSQQEFIRATRHLGVHGVGAARAELLARGSILAREAWSKDYTPMRLAVSLVDTLTNPIDPRFLGWPLPDRNPSLEAADIAITLLEGMAYIQEPLSYLPKWLEVAAHADHVYGNNWQFAPILAQLVLQKLGRQTDKALLRHRCEQLCANARDGLYFDSAGTFDYYAFWAWHYYLHHLRIHFGSDAPSLPDAEATLGTLDCLVTSDGSLIRVGRSCEYQEAALFPCLSILATHRDRKIREKARTLYWAFWKSRLSIWMSADWTTFFAHRGDRHCSEWFYGTTYSCLWALRGIDANLLANLAAQEASITKRLPGQVSVLPRTGVFVRSHVVNSHALRVLPRRFSRIQPMSHYGAQVFAQAGDVRVTATISLNGLAFAASASLGSFVYDSDHRITVALMPTGKSVWMAVQPPDKAISVQLRGLDPRHWAQISAQVEIASADQGSLLVKPQTRLLLCMRLDGSPWIAESLQIGFRDEPPNHTIRALSDTQKHFESLYGRFDDPWGHANFRRWVANLMLADLMLKDQVDWGAVLDVGCGRGDTVALLRDLGIPSVGIDISRAAIVAGRKRWPMYASAISEGTIESSISFPPNLTVLLKDVDYYVPQGEGKALVTRVQAASGRILLVRTGSATRLASPLEGLLRRNFWSRPVKHELDRFPLSVTEFRL